LKTANSYSASLTATTSSQTLTLPAGSGEVLIVNDHASVSVYLDLAGNEATSDDWELKATEVLVLSEFRTKAISYLAASSTVGLRVLVLY